MFWVSYFEARFATLDVTVTAFHNPAASFKHGETSPEIKLKKKWKFFISLEMCDIT